MSKPKYDRKYLGNMPFSPKVAMKETLPQLTEEMTQEREEEILGQITKASRYNQKHLKAYLRGEESFVWGKKTIKGRLGEDVVIPNYLPVKQQLNIL